MALTEPPDSRNARPLDSFSDFDFTPNNTPNSSLTGTTDFLTPGDFSSYRNQPESPSSSVSSVLRSAREIDDTIWSKGGRPTAKGFCFSGRFQITWPPRSCVAITGNVSGCCLWVTNEAFLMSISMDIWISNVIRASLAVDNSSSAMPTIKRRS
ncbi:hypothetical protein AMATHDRAFT_49571 [Amanita thiersii Skay4041]|uniref:Uncharacterized protein n=1 Tax=Amanita thiersii Skay4041 TaxID=703135 RepID=A0A2A9NBH1_9AGAR|nr:hypothetical protein AMATHDRAFT_49571 [Amanita thiersii Skay4041]